MNGLTQKDDLGNWSLRGVPWESLHEGKAITKELWERLYGALWKLMEYEDTGLSPEEVEQLKESRRWIPVEERLPDNLVNPITRDAYVYPVTVDLGGVTDIRYYSFWRGHWYNQGPKKMDYLVTAWMPLPEPYKPEN